MEQFPHIKPNTAVGLHLISRSDALVMVLQAVLGHRDPVLGDCLQAMADALVQIEDPRLAPLCLCCPQRITGRGLGMLVMLIPFEETAPNERTAICNCLCADCVRGHSKDDLWHMVKRAYAEYAPGFLIEGKRH